MNKIEQPSVGIKAVLDQALQSYERLPMLEIIFDKFARQLAIALRNLTSEPINVEIKKINFLRFSTYLKTLQTPSSLAVFRAIEWENFGLLIIDNGLIFSFIDLLLGGKKNINHSVMDEDKRSLTSIEQGLARQISEVILNELSSAFESISPTTFLIERLENNPNFATIVRPGDAIIVLTIAIELDEQWEKLDLMIPYKTIEPIKQQMQQVFLGDRLGSDTVWEEMMLNVVYHVDLPMEAVIINKPVPLNEVANLKIGDTIITDYKQDEDIIIRSGLIALFRGQVGKVENKVAISIKNVIEE
jgi:flagellar motor switch protein FliM